jgi:hypothetical protein
MRLLLIIVGVLVILWLGFLTIDRNGVQQHLNNHDQQFEDVDNNINSLDERYQTKDGFLSEENPIDRAEDGLDKTEDKADKKFEMPYEEDTTNENTNLKEDDNADPQTDNNNEIDLKPNPNVDSPNLDENDLDKENKKEKHKNTRASLELENDSVVAFGYVTDHMYRDQSVEAFQLDLEQEEVITAFRVR